LSSILASSYPSICLSGFLVLSAVPALRADQHTGIGQHASHSPQSDTAAGWQWAFDGTAFVGLNYQHRKFDDKTG
jgi:hypothetical protein